MSKASTEAEFSSAIVQDRTWRLREISDLKSAIQRADESTRQVLLRALVAICYAHWEGYVRSSARKYMDYVARRRLRYSELAPQFLKNRFILRLAVSALHTTSLNERARLIDEIREGHEARFSRSDDDLIDTHSNLSSKVISEICFVCAMPDESFVERATFIDLILLKRRNSIAHGEDTLVAIDSLDEVIDGTIELMRSFGDQLENLVSLGRYRNL